MQNFLAGQDVVTDADLFDALRIPDLNSKTPLLLAKAKDQVSMGAFMALRSACAAAGALLEEPTEVQPHPPTVQHASSGGLATSEDIPDFQRIRRLLASAAFGEPLGKSLPGKALLDACDVAARAHGPTLADLSSLKIPAGPMLPLSACCGPRDPNSEDQEDVVEGRQNQPQTITNNEAAVAAAASFCQTEWMSLLQGLIANDPIVAQAVQAQLHAIMVDRQEMGQDKAMPQQSAAAAASPSGSPQQMLKDADDKVPEALAALHAAELALGRDDLDLQAARRMLQERTMPPARGAAGAERLVHQMLSICPRSAEKAIKQAKLHIRNILVLRCRAFCPDPKDRKAFEEKIIEAFEGDVDLDKRSQLLQAYHKDSHTYSNSQQLAVRSIIEVSSG